jgi:hypothetical protein
VLRAAAADASARGAPHSAITFLERAGDDDLASQRDEPMVVAAREDKRRVGVVSVGCRVPDAGLDAQAP